ncbi:amidohydrolase [Bosea caraganae]|uniref:Amidohydrolase n=1 Tax=Bosea caraganae TaxID=2763117 RepID=A0A370L851_9HYPH|nr:amidohydrolase family protein [Bosea caraganae]RDJ25518.1 amidohydrolase [Bosea caraganae]RDJ25695.1 amidohydrolase [Bosea caraganae]
MIDFHFHAIPPRFVDAVRRGELANVLEIDASDGDNRLVFHAPEGIAVEPGMRIRPNVFDEHLILSAMDAMQLEAVAMSSPPEYFMYWASPEDGERLARLVNDGYAEWAKAWPERFLPLATVPMQDPVAACRELRRAIGELGLRGVAICTHVSGRELDDPVFEPFFATVAELGVPLFLHPQNGGDAARLANHHMWNVVGFPFETAQTATRLILSGVLARHSALKLVLAHGGGYLPYQLGRLDHAWHAREHLRRACPEPPSAYLRNIYCDSLVHGGVALRFLSETVGADHVVLGSDYPFDMGSKEPVMEVSAAGLDARRLRTTALALLTPG